MRTVRVTPPPPGSRPRVTSGRPISIFGVVDRDPVVAGQRDLEAAAERGAVDRGDDRLAERLEPAQVGLDRLERREDALGVLGVGLRACSSGRRRRRTSSWREVTTTPVIVVLLGVQPVDRRVPSTSA